MSNADTYREMVIKFNASDGDWESVRGYYHPDFRMTAVDVPARLTFDEMLGAFDEDIKFSVGIHDMVEYGDDLVTRVKVTATQNGKAESFDMIGWLTYKDGLLYANTGYTNTPTRLREIVQLDR